MANGAETKKSTFIESKARSAFSNLGTDDLRKSFASALKQSITIDISNSSNPNPASVNRIKDKYGFQPEIQKSYFLAVNKQSAKLFLMELGYPVNTNFDRLYNRISYKEKFNREPYVFGVRQMVLTYAEWLHFVDYTFEPEFPDFLSPYL